MNFIELCQKFISIDSTPQQGNKDLAVFVSELCSEWGLSSQLYFESSQDPKNCNLVVTPKDMPTDDGGMLLQTHLDTSEPGVYALWTKTNSNPFNSSIYGDDLYGLGAADSKLDFLCKLMALKDYKNKSFKKPLYLVGTYGKESGMQGAIKLIRHGQIKAKSALVGEPTSLQLVHACSGLAHLEIKIPFTQQEKDYHSEHNSTEKSQTQSKVFYGKAAHSGYPIMGENAIILMLEYLKKLPEGVVIMDLAGGVGFQSVPENAFVEFDISGDIENNMASKVINLVEQLKELEEDFQKYPDESFYPPVTTMNLGTITTTDDEVIISGSCRVPPAVKEPIYSAWIKKVGSICETLGAEFNIKEYRKPFMLSSKSDFLKKAYELMLTSGFSTSLIKSSVCTEANIFSRFGIESLVLGPGKGIGNSYAPNEKVSIKELHQATEFYKKMIESNCV